MKFQSLPTQKIFIGPRSSFAYIQKIFLLCVLTIISIAVVCLISMFCLYSSTRPLFAEFVPQLGITLRANNVAELDITQQFKLIARVYTSLGYTSDFINFDTEATDINLHIKAQTRFPFRCNVTKTNCAVEIIQREILTTNVVPGKSTVTIVKANSDIIFTEFSIIIITISIIFTFWCMWIASFQLCKNRIDSEFETDHEVRCVVRNLVI